MPAYINDGYSITATIPAVEDAPELEVEYRPMLGGEAQRYAIASLKAQDSGDIDRMESCESRLMKAIAEKVVKWDLSNGGKPVKPSADAMRRMHPAQFDKLYGLVAGYSKPEMKDDGSEGESQQSADSKN